MLTADRLSGILPALTTPVDQDDRVDAGAVRAHFAWLFEHGIDGVLPLGGTGEYGALSQGERRRMVSLCAEEMSGKGPVIAGVLDPGYHDALQSAKDFAAEGADAVLLVTPYYTNPTQAGIRDYYLRFADESPVPVLIYEIPYRTRIAIEPKVLHELSRHHRIIGMKACNTDMYHFLQVIAGVAPDFAVLSGEDILFPLQVAAGARGGIIVTANLVPGLWREIYDAARSGDLSDALPRHRRLMPLINMAFAETNPGPMKAVMDLIGVNAPRPLAPLVTPDPELVSSLRTELAALLKA
ncbi:MULTISPECIES: 4-hydroxy-tetrahydrodipicolinate synthase [unclassified Chelatococcus]|uniref:4-hydroxy-tetrahydrodipicolinate synthase n=1 Tax=unclassified Chelatococcus TaxID=2638111 RepID=UPI001BCBA33D|nr:MULTISPECIES: 4-hydroxy-tetrahydrodipicolinate synthase [unclassified Chelatococcus]CAH1671162.1 Dihydrodipicolinate synthase [Hyphomicrobiales bacterium]MBS7739112.1 4-hydroxy-tetrahydrodipicolinate synthase [Chelatococcus sp. HY11]MBX3543547.1 4-hydroxy-tetrahydrodipicolinate synthase [Chelatococcus sp.]MCO5076358.1 4-hydroxy-tetrahydrodipicolinate synthase [Chelatococcus sp.]CAH1676643.1 Dihydrodipicolinate synthase [Hyphomicrobiales bacterium]